MRQGNASFHQNASWPSTLNIRLKFMLQALCDIHATCVLCALLGVCDTVDKSPVGNTSYFDALCPPPTNPKSGKSLLPASSLVLHGESQCP